MKTIKLVILVVIINLVTGMFITGGYDYNSTTAITDELGGNSNRTPMIQQKIQDLNSGTTQNILTSKSPTGVISNFLESLVNVLTFIPTLTILLINTMIPWQQIIGLFSACTGLSSGIFAQLTCTSLGTETEWILRIIAWLLGLALLAINIQMWLKLIGIVIKTPEI